ncbi:MAG: hypothetical protein K5640_03815 [Treponema sp.]|nr:hypothetical protein [Treponema sp.]
MSKTHRGSGLREQPSHGRGTCPICHKENIKVIYEQEVDGKQVKICKYCNAALKNKSRLNKASAAPATEAPAEESAAEAPEQA